MPVWAGPCAVGCGQGGVLLVYSQRGVTGLAHRVPSWVE